jgi:ATP-dependent Lon protease
MEEILLPLFPLDVVLLPEEVLPLHIFEDRYKQMIGELLEAKSIGRGKQEFGVVLTRDGPILPVGCTARLVNVTRKYPDGRLDILTVGRRRYEVLMVNEELPYLRAAVDFFEDEPHCDVAPDAQAAPAIDLFRDVIQVLRKSTEMPIHFTKPYRYLSFRIAGSLPFEADFKQQLLSIRREEQRLELVTAATRKMKEHFLTLHQARTKAGGNGNVHR